MKHRGRAVEPKQEHGLQKWCLEVECQVIVGQEGYILRMRYRNLPDSPFNYIDERIV